MIVFHPSISTNQSSRNSVFFTFVLSVSGNNSFNLDVKAPRDMRSSGSRNSKGAFEMFFSTTDDSYLYNVGFILDHTKWSMQSHPYKTVGKIPTIKNSIKLHYRKFHFSWIFHYNMIFFKNTSIISNIRKNIWKFWY